MNNNDNHGHSKHTSGLLLKFLIAGLGLVHAAALIGYVEGSFPLGIAADALDLIACTDAAVALGAWASRKKNLSDVGFGAALACMSCFILALSPAYFSDFPDKRAGASIDQRLDDGSTPSQETKKNETPNSREHNVFRATLLQANLQAKGFELRALGEKAKGIDLIALAESRLSDSTEWAKPLGLRMNAFYPEHGDSAIWSRWPEIEKGCLMDRDAHCQAVWALLATEAGPLRVFALHTLSPHLPLRAAARDDFLQRILPEFVKTLPPGEARIAMGDFNATFGSKSMRALINQTGWSSADNRTPTWPTSTAIFGIGFRIDHQLAGGLARIDQQSTINSHYSDHLWSLAHFYIHTSSTHNTTPAQVARVASIP
jgi:hypothetical protein